MKVLMMTGDKRFGPGHPRYELQKSAVEELALVYWGRGSVVPRIPAGHFDVVTVQDPFFRGLYAWRIARRIGAKFNVQVHADLDGQSFIKRLLARFLLSRADSIRVVSDRIVRYLKTKNYKLKTEPFVLPVFVDISKFRGIVRREHAGKNILWVGRFEEEKNPLQAITILKEVLKHEPAARLIMLGQGSLQGAIAERADGLPVELPGWQSLLQYLDTADVVLSTSRHESWGASLIEALAAGVPVVAPDVGVAREAGATVVSREKLAKAVVEVLTTGAKGELRLQLPDVHEWATRWRESLL